MNWIKLNVGKGVVRREATERKATFEMDFASHKGWMKADWGGSTPYVGLRLVVDGSFIYYPCQVGCNINFMPVLPHLDLQVAELSYPKTGEERLPVDYKRGGKKQCGDY